MKSYLITYQVEKMKWDEKNNEIVKLEIKNNIIYQHPLKWLEEHYYKTYKYTLLFWESVELEDLNLKSDFLDTLESY